MGTELNNLDIDVFINIAVPHLEEIDQLQESIRMVSQFRKTVHAHTLLPSTPHALCRLFLGSKRLLSILNVLENRIEYGIFPDFFALNLLIDNALGRDEYNIACRLSNLVMLQEEFGQNYITDCLSLFSIAKYAEMKSNFVDWETKEDDPVLTGMSIQSADAESEIKETTNDAKEEEENYDDEEEEDAEYIRVPFLRNPYFDNHFDLKNPRILCGKTLSMLGSTFSLRGETELGLKSKLLGEILQGKWSEADVALNSLASANLKLGALEDLSKFYIENLHEVEAGSDEQKSSLLSKIDKLSGESYILSELAESRCKNLGEYEQQDINLLKTSISDWSNHRLSVQQDMEDRKKRKELIELIKKKKEELKRKEQYLYFYDNLKKSRVTRIEYD